MPQFDAALNTDKHQKLTDAVYDPVVAEWMHKAQNHALTAAGVWIPLTVDAGGNLKVAEHRPGIGGTATAGTEGTITDATKDFEPDMLAGLPVAITTGGIDYLRTIIGNTADTLTFIPLGSLGTAATAKIGDAGAGEVTITVAVPGSAGNNYSVEALQPTEPDIPLSAVLVGDLLTVTLATNASGEPSSVGMDVAAAIDALAEFTALMTGPGGMVAPTAEPVPFTGGEDGLSVQVGDSYQIKSRAWARA